MRIFKWLYPGMKIKRWIVLAVIGVLMLGVGLARFVQDITPILKLFDGILIAIGALAVLLGMFKIIKSFIVVILPQKEKSIVDIIYQKRYLAKGLDIVVIGGGTGLSTMLQGLKEYTSNITAIVTVADSGGSSGRLREQFDVLPPGDIRNCLVALADTEPLMRQLFQFRFQSDSELDGHNFGNLFITALTKITGDFDQAIKESSKVLAIRGKVIPSTLDNVQLVAEHKDGSLTEGEDAIPKRKLPIKRIFLRPSDAVATPEALAAIEEATLIIIGPGSLYTSIIPNLLVRDITEALKKADAKKVYVGNVMTQPGETDNFKASDHLKALIEHSHPRILDFCIMNNAGIVSQNLLDKYKQEDSFPVEIDRGNIRKMGYRIIEEDVVSLVDYVRHDPKKLAKAIISYFDSRFK